MRTRIGVSPYRDELLKSIKNPEAAAEYLSACLQDEDPRVFLMALRDVADARGGMRMFSGAGNPSLESLTAVLRAVGLRLSVQSQKSKRRTPRAA